MSEDLSEFIALSEIHTQCGVGRALTDSRLTRRQRVQLKAALDSPFPLRHERKVSGGITHRGIQKWLEKRGINVRDDTVARHRKKECTCHG